MTIKYIAWVTQNGEGCDYGIGCGQTIWELKAQNGPEIDAEIEGRIAKSTHREWAERYKSMTLYEVTRLCQVPVAELYRKEEGRLAALAIQDIERAERATYERLKGKYDVDIST